MRITEHRLNFITFVFTFLHSCSIFVYAGCLKASVKNSRNGEYFYKDGPKIFTVNKVQMSRDNELKIVATSLFRSRDLSIQKAFL